MDTKIKFYEREGNTRNYSVLEEVNSNHYKGKVLEELDGLEVLLRDDKDMREAWRTASNCPTPQMLYDHNKKEVLAFGNNISLSEAEGGINVFIDCIYFADGGLMMHWRRQYEEHFYDGEKLEATYIGRSNPA